MMGKNIGFVSTRFSGTDGVSLEASKWAEVLEQYGFHCFWFAGEIDRDPGKSHLVPEAHFQCAQNQGINAQILYNKQRRPETMQKIHHLRTLLASQLSDFIHRFKIDILIVQNALAIPMNIPLGLALTDVIAKTGIPTIAHHHDFYWERSRYTRNYMDDYIQMAFPPKLPSIKHVVINSEAQANLALRTGIPSVIIPNVLDFKTPPVVNEKKSRDFREYIGLKPEDKMVLQPTRIIQRKGIEHAIELVRVLNDPSYKLVISHEAGDEGYEYCEWLKTYAKKRRVDLRIVPSKISSPWIKNGQSPQDFSLWDIYPNAAFVCYPSLYEGFGNALLEAIYFKKPLLVNRYKVFVKDIEPKGFDFAIMDGILSRDSIQQVRNILESPEKQASMVNHNFDIASKHYSYDVLSHTLKGMIDELTEKQYSPIVSNRSNVLYLNQNRPLANDDVIYESSRKYAVGK